MQKNALYIARLYMLKENKKSKLSLLADYCLSNIDSLDKLTITELSRKDPNELCYRLPLCEGDWRFGL